MLLEEVISKNGEQNASETKCGQRSSRKTPLNLLMTLIIDTPGDHLPY